MATKMMVTTTINGEETTWAELLSDQLEERVFIADRAVGDEDHLGEAAGFGLAGKRFDEYPSARKYRDFRKMFDDMTDKIDAVCVSTPDHTHAVVPWNGLAGEKTGRPEHLLDRVDPDHARLPKQGPHRHLRRGRGRKA